MRGTRNTGSTSNKVPQGPPSLSLSSPLSVHLSCLLDSLLLVLLIFSSPLLPVPTLSPGITKVGCGTSHRSVAAAGSRRQCWLVCYSRFGRTLLGTCHSYFHHELLQEPMSRPPWTDGTAQHKTTWNLKKVTQPTSDHGRAAHMPCIRRAQSVLWASRVVASSPELKCMQRCRRTSVRHGVT